MHVWLHVVESVCSSLANAPFLDGAVIMQHAQCFVNLLHAQFVSYSACCLSDVQD